MTILSLFALELLLLLIGEGPHFFDNYMQVFDVAVIAVSLHFELNGDQLAATGVMLARLWRLVRLTHGMHEQVDKAKEVRIAHSAVLPAYPPSVACIVFVQAFPVSLSPTPYHALPPPIPYPNPKRPRSMSCSLSPLVPWSFANRTHHSTRLT